MIKPRKKYFKSIVVLASAAALVVVGSVMAYFSSTDQTTNKFTGSRFDIFLMETRWDAEKAKGVLPGDELEKNPQVINKEHTDGYIYLRVTVPCDVQMVDNDNGTPKANALENVPMYKFVTTAGTSDTTFSPAQAVNDNWTLVQVTGSQNGYTYFDEENDKYIYVYAYTDGANLNPLHQNEITNPLFDKLKLWNFNESYDPDENHGVRVEALGIQTDLPGHDAGDIVEIWQLLESEVGT